RHRGPAIREGPLPVAAEPGRQRCGGQRVAAPAARLRAHRPGALRPDVAGVPRQPHPRRLCRAATPARRPGGGQQPPLRGPGCDGDPRDPRIHFGVLPVRLSSTGPGSTHMALWPRRQSPTAAVWVLPDQVWMPTPLSVVERLDVVTGPFAYLRLLGDREA